MVLFRLSKAKVKYDTQFGIQIGFDAFTAEGKGPGCFPQPHDRRSEHPRGYEAEDAGWIVR
jgi:hypothetical protein